VSNTKTELEKMKMADMTYADMVKETARIFSSNLADP
jgi:hypothetical protein